MQPLEILMVLADHPQDVIRLPRHKVAFEHLGNVRVVVALGRIGFDAWLRLLGRRGLTLRPRPSFAHGAVASFGPHAPMLIGCYHPSRQNTNTGVLTAPMMDAVFTTARRLMRT